MSKVSLWHSILLATGAVVLISNPAWTETIENKELLTQGFEQNTEKNIIITDVKLNQTDTALEILLETVEGESLNAETRIEGNSIIAYIPNAILTLPNPEGFRTDNPSPGISAVTVSQISSNQVQLIVEGETEVPIVQVFPISDALVFSIANTAENLEILVTATRRAEPLSKVPRSITVITRDDIEEQTTGTNNLHDILGNLVPGFSPPNNRNNSFGLTLRGREISVLIDGVPQNTNQSSIPGELSSIDPDSIERIEVIRGPNAIYGGKATGGLVNIITRKPSESQLNSETEIGFNNSLTHGGDSFGYDLKHTISGTEGKFDWLASFSINTTGGYFDADGDRIVTDLGTEDSTALNGLLKFGVDLTENQRLQFSFNHYNFQQDTDFTTDTSIADIEGVQKARAIPIPEGTEIIGGEDNVFITTTNLNLQYINKNIWGSELQSQFFYRDYAFNGIGIPQDLRGSIFDAIFQSPGESQQIGGRLQIDTPLNKSKTASLLWGVDFVNEKSENRQILFDPDEFDASGGLIYRKIGERTFVPEYNFNDLGIFAQAQWEISNNLTISGGVRYVNLNVSTDDFTTVEGNQVEGGSVNADDIVFNAGITYNLTEQISLFTSFAQGFSFPDIGRAIRFAGNGTSIDSLFDLTEPQKVNNYELGIRGNWKNVQASLAGFYNYSKLGVDFVTLEGGAFETIRAPRRVYGVEATLDWQPSDNWKLGSSFTWLEGENDIADDGEGFLALDSFTIPPWKLTAYLENETLPGWRNRLQMLFSGNRDSGFEDGSDGAPIESYLTVDFTSSVKIGKGELVLGIQNLFNEDYFPVYSQTLAPFYDPSNFPGRGRSLSLSYKIKW